MSSDCNPADLASRGMGMHDLSTSELWWHGPRWLQEHSSNWPKSGEAASHDFEIDRKPIRVHYAYFSDFQDILDRFSSFPKAIRIVAYVYRFYYRTHPKYR